MSSVFSLEKGATQDYDLFFSYSKCNASFAGNGWVGYGPDKRK